MIVSVTIGDVVHKLDTDELTLDEWDAIETEFKVTWTNFNPWRSAREAKAIVSIISKRFDIDSAAIATAAQFADVVEFVVDDDRPKEYQDGIPPQAAEPSTDTSCGSTAIEVGLPA